MFKSIIKIAKTNFLFFILLIVLYTGCSNSNRQENTQRLIDLIAEVERLKLQVESKQIEKKQLENQLAIKEEKIKEYTDKKDFVEKRCP